MRSVKLQSLFTIVLLFGLVILPFIYWSSAAIPFEIPRVWFTHRWIECLSLIGFVYFLGSKSSSINRRGSFLVLALLLISILSSVVGVDVFKSFAGNIYRGDGLVTLAKFVGFSFIVGLIYPPKWNKYLVGSVLAGSSLMSLFTIFTALSSLVMTPSFPSWNGAYGITFGQPNFLGGYLAITFPFYLYAFLKGTSLYKHTAVILAILQFIAIALTHSWGSVLSIVLVALIFVGIEYRQDIKKIFPLVGLSIVGVILLVGYIWWQQNNLPVSVNAESRQRIYTKLTLAFLERPLLGWGWANVDYAFRAIDWPVHLSQDVYVDKAHSSLLEFLVTTGLSGGLLFVGLLLHSLRTLWKNSQAPGDHVWWKSLFFVLLLYSIHSQTNVVGIAEEVFFWLIIGFSLQKLSF